jgi:hypothetical protein
MAAMAQRIGEMLVEDGACSREGVRDALRSQVIFGGRVGTNLLEADAVAEQALARALGRRHGCLSVSGTVKPEPEAVRLVPAELADRWEIVPLQVAERRVTVAACDPSDLAMLDEVAFATGRNVRALVAAEARIWALLRSEYGLIRQLRGIELEQEPEGRAAPALVPAERAPVSRDLMDEAWFEQTYGSGTAPPGAGARAEDEVIDLTPEMAEAPPVEAPPPPATAPPVPPPPPEPEPTPLGFDEAMATLAGVAERAAIAKVVLRYARTRLRRAVLFTVHPGAAHGWVGMGVGLAGRDVQAIRLRLGVPGVLDTVVRTRAHYLGPLPRTEANVRLLKVLGGGVPGNALLVPILGLGRVVNVIYADGGRGAMVDAGGVGELLILATRIAQSYEAMVARV